MTKSLVKLAVFDPDDMNGKRVIGSSDGALAGTPAASSRRRSGFRGASRAAAAIVRLNAKQAIPSLINFLDEPDPAAPLFVLERKHSGFAVRELVRINHNRNCQLCHVAVDRNDRSDPGQVVATVPSPAEPLPPSISQQYYGSHGSGPQTP